MSDVPSLRRDCVQLDAEVHVAEVQSCPSSTVKWKCEFAVNGQQIVEDPYGYGMTSFDLDLHLRHTIGMQM